MHPVSPSLLYPYLASKIILISRLQEAIQFSSVIQSCLTLFDPMNHSMPGLPVHHQSQSSPKLMSIESVMQSNHLILCYPFLLLPSVFPSIRVFSNESVLHSIGNILNLILEGP